MKQLLTVLFFVQIGSVSLAQTPQKPLPVEPEDGTYALTLTPFIDAMGYGTDIYYHLPFEVERPDEEVLFSISLTNNSGVEITIVDIQNAQESTVARFPESIAARKTVEGTLKIKPSSEEFAGEDVMRSTLVIMGEPGKMKYHLIFRGSVK